MSTVQLYLGDCLDVMKSIPAGSVDAVITDPPYGIGADKRNAHSSIRDNSRWRDVNWDNRQPRAVAHAITMAPVSFVWGGNFYTDVLPPSGRWLVWLKPQMNSGFSLSDAELCWSNSIGSIRAKMLPRRDGNLHPTQKPLSVMGWCLALAKLPEGVTILDPFMGSGTTGVAAIARGYNFIGIESDPTYFEIAKRRIAEAQVQLRLPEPEAQS